MPIIASSTGSPRILMESGNHVARCYRIIYFGAVPSEYMGVESIKKKVQLSFEFPTQQHVFNEEVGEQPFTLHKTYTLSLSEKANLRKNLESWRGKEFTKEELLGFDIETVLGAPLMIQVGEKTKDDGSNINTILSMASIPKGMAVPAPINPNFLFSVDSFDPMKFELLPDWQKEEIKTSVEYKELQNGAAPATPEEPLTSDPIGDDPADDLPF